MRVECRKSICTLISVNQSLWFTAASGSHVVRAGDEGEYAGIKLGGETEPGWAQLDDEGLEAEVEKYRGALRSAVKCVHVPIHTSCAESRS